MTKRIILLLAVTVVGVFQSAQGQNIAIKINLLANGLLNPNLGIEIGLAPKWTFEVDGQYDWLQTGDGSQIPLCIGVVQ